MKKIALITGATSGIGEACAKILAANGYELILTGRRQERLESIRAALEQSHGTSVLTLQLDVRDKNEVENKLNQLPEKWQHISVLINNAGLALGRDNFADANLADWENMMQTNVMGVMYVTKAVLPMLQKKSNAHIINIGSIAGKEVYENGNGYCASKFAIDALSKSMRIDLLRTGIKVTVIHPGAANTEFSLVRYKGDQKKADATYNGFTPMTGKDIADAIYYCIQLPPHVCINELVIMPTAQASSMHFHKQD